MPKRRHALLLAVSLTLAALVPLLQYSSAQAASAGQWQSGDLPFNGLPSGKPFHYDYLLPDGYNSSTKYPVLFYEHEDCEGDNWYYGGGDPLQLVNAGMMEFDSFNTTAFRSRYPAIIVVPYADQQSGCNDTVYNFGGYGDSPGSGPNEQAVTALAKYFIGNFSVDSHRIYITGDSLGGIGTEATMLDYNSVNGPIDKVFAAGLPYAGQIYRNANPTSDQATINRMHDVPVFAVSGSNDGTSPPEAYNRPMWRALAGNSNYPSSSPGGQAGSSQYHYLEDPGLGHDVWGTYRGLPGGQPMYDWLFAQAGPGGTGTTPGTTPTPNPTPTPTPSPIPGPPAPPPSSVLMFASPQNVAAGGASTITWAAVYGTSCTGSGFTANGISGFVTVYPMQTTTYTVNCSGAFGTQSGSVTVTVGGTSPAPAPSPFPTPSPFPVPSPFPAPTPTTPSGGGGTFSISARVATFDVLRVRSSASLSGSVLGVEQDGAAGTIIEGPQTANGHTWWQVRYDDGLTGWSVADFLSVLGGSNPQTPAGNTGSPTTAAIVVNPPTISAGQAATLTWSSVQETSCSGINFNPTGTSGSVSVNPTQTTTYTVTCGQGTWSTTLTVPGTTPSTNPTPSPTPFPSPIPTPQPGSESAIGASVIPGNGTLVDFMGNKWTLTSSGQVLQNGKDMNAAPANLLVYANFVVYERTTSNQWFLWGGIAWVSVTGDPRGGSTTPTPAPTPGPTSAPMGTIKIMPLGDSVTAGGGNPPPPGGYRAPLYTMLTNDGYTIQYVGDQTSNSGGGLPSNQINHQGIGGIRTEDLQTYLQQNNILSTYNPQVILLMSGNNDMFSTNAMGPQPAFDLLVTMARYLTSTLPNAKIIVSTVQPHDQPGTGGQQEEDQYNQLIKTQITSVSPNVSVADSNALMTYNADIGPDGVHPNATGNQHIAQAYEGVIKAVLGSATTPTPTPTGPQASGTRHYWQQPGTNNSVWNTPLGDGAVWGGANDADTIDLDRGGNLNSTNYFGQTEWVGSASDPIYNLQGGKSVGDQQTGTVQLHLPSNVFAPGPFPGDNNADYYDPTNAFGLVFHTGNPTNINGNTITGGLRETENAMADNYGEDQETGLSGFDTSAGTIRGYDVQQINAGGHMRHMLRYATDAHYLKDVSSCGAGCSFQLPATSWPQKYEDWQSGGNVYSGNLPAGTTAGIPMNTPMPAGLTKGGQELFWTLQHYGALFRDQGGGGMNFTDDQDSDTTDIVSGMKQDVATIVRLLRPLRNQHVGGQSFTTSPKNGPGNRVDGGPPALSSN